MVIYITTNLINGKRYIGLDSHNNPKYLGSGDALVAAVNKYGRENFKKEILENCNSLEELSNREEYWINFYNALKSKEFYNLRPGGKKNFNLSLETREKISKSNLGKSKICLFPEKRRERKILAMKGKIFSDEHKKKISESKKGVKRSEEFKRQMSERRQKEGGKRIIQKDIFGKIVKIYTNRKEALKFPIGESTLSEALTKNKLAKGYYWEYGEK